MKDIVETRISGVDLFCGVGGLTFGLERAGVSVVAGYDLDPSCEFPYAKNTDSYFFLRDINKLSAVEIKRTVPEGDVFLLAGCAPCQPFSTYSNAPKKKRESDGLHGAARLDDWALVERFANLISELQPDIVTMENVPPLKDQPVFKTLLASLDGYYFDYKVINCADIGLPQSRNRLVLVASRLGMIALPDSSVRKKTVRDAIGHLPPISAGEKHQIDPLHAASGLNEKNLKRIKASRPGGTWRDWPEDLIADCHKKSSGKTFPSVYGRMEWDKQSPTITTQCFGFGNGRFGHPEQNRALSLREAAMLQGFPETYSFLNEGEVASFSKIGRLIGNAVPVTLGEYIGDSLQSHVQQWLR